MSVYCFYENFNVEFYLYENVEHVSYFHVRDGYETAVAVVDYELASEVFACEIVHATGSVGHIAEDETVNLAESIENVSDKRRMHQKPFWKLQANLHRLILLSLFTRQNFLNSLRNLITIIPRQNATRLSELPNIDSMLFLKFIRQQVIQRMLLP